jgi:hypothetical protein
MMALFRSNAMKLTVIILPIAIIVFALWKHIKYLYDEIEKLQTENIKLESENFDLELRVHDMERQLCNGKHRWRQVWASFNQGVQENKYVCGRCGKVIVTPLDYVEDVE